MTEVTYTQARANFAQLCDEVASTREPVIIKRRGAPDVALISADELSSMEETLHVFASPANALRVLEALQRIKRGEGRVQTVDELRRELGPSDGIRQSA